MIQLREPREAADAEQVVEAAVREATATARVEKKKVQGGKPVTKAPG